MRSGFCLLLFLISSVLVWGLEQDDYTPLPESQVQSLLNPLQEALTLVKQLKSEQTNSETYTESLLQSLNTLKQELTTVEGQLTKAWKLSSEQKQLIADSKKQISALETQSTNLNQSLQDSKKQSEDLVHQVNDLKTSNTIMTYALVGLGVVAATGWVLFVLEKL